MRWLVVMLVVGCGSQDEPAPPPRSPPAVPVPSAMPATPPSPRPPVPSGSDTPQPFSEQAERRAQSAESLRTIAYRATWSNVRGIASCWYFSGPTGRDSPLGTHAVVRVGDQALLEWGKARFEGTWGAQAIDVSRLARHEYQGAWVITERLVGRVQDRAIHATYTYEECQADTPCTDTANHCRLTADVVLVEERD